MPRIPCPSEAWDAYYHDQEDEWEEDTDEVPILTIRDFTYHIGIEPLASALRAIDKYNLEHVWLVVAGGKRLYYHLNSDELNALPLTTVVTKVGAGCIAWDGSDWEYSSEREFRSPRDIDAVRQDCRDAFDEYQFIYGEE